jgi:hypothetical protein
MAEALRSLVLDALRSAGTGGITVTQIRDAIADVSLIAAEVTKLDAEGRIDTVNTESEPLLRLIGRS